MSKLVMTGSVVVLVGLLVAASASGGAAQDSEAIDLAFISTASGHTATVMERGARQAAADLGVSLGYEALGSVGLARVAERIEAAAATRPDGLAVTVEAAEVLAASIEAATASGIPVISVGPGSGETRPTGILLQVGPDESVAGIAAGRQMGSLGVKNGLCLKVEIGDPANVRCSAAATGLAETGGALHVLSALDPAGDPSGIQGAIAARLRADPTIDGILLTDATSTSQALAAVKGADRLSSVTLATFDIGADALDALDAGEMAFVIDQQPFLQGYLAVLSMALYARYGLLPGGGEPLLVGPVTVTEQDVARVRQLERQGIR